MTLEELNSQSLTPVVVLPEFGCFVVRENSQLFTCPILEDGTADMLDGEVNWCEVTDPEPGFVEAAEKALGWTT